MPKCPHCPAEYSTQEEVDRHYEARWRHLSERLEASESEVRKLRAVLTTITEIPSGFVTLDRSKMLGALIERVSDLARAALAGEPVMAQATPPACTDPCDHCGGVGGKHAPMC